MTEVVRDRVRELATEIESMRDELCQAAMNEGELPMGETAYSISDRLDRLILEFIHLRDQVSQDTD